MKKHVLLYFVLLAVIVGLVIFKSHGKNVSEVLVKNESGMVISTLSIQLHRYPTIHLVENLNPGGNFKIEFSNFSDSHYVLKGMLENGTPINQEIGYVTSSMDFKHTLIINQKGTVNLK